MLPLYIFDIDNTLLRPNIYTSIFQVRQGLYDKNLLTPLFNTCQIALASYNNEGMSGSINGRKLGRAILDLQHPTGDSRRSVSDEFIQAWIFPTISEMAQWGKNLHIQGILKAYVDKWGCRPPKIYFWDDRPENVYLASKMGITGYLVKNGLTGDCLYTSPKICTKNIIRVNRRQLYTCINTRLRQFGHYIDSIDDDTFAIYLSNEGDFQRFIRGLNECGIAL